ncbi:MAG: hypothetical protein HS116_02275 [Planctomycetes bacterium]|nr:hypothetical protein [Planctomycetota bacterium]
MHACSRPHCSGSVYAHGLCKPHYSQRRQEIILASGRVCSTPGCRGPEAYTRLKLCRTCYSRDRRHALRAAQGAKEVEASQAGRTDYLGKLQSAYRNATNAEARLRMRRLLEGLTPQRKGA